MPADPSRPLLRPSTGPLSWPAALRLVLVLVSAGWAGAQRPPPSDDSYGDFSSANFNPSLAIIIAVVVAFFFFMGFFSIYLRGCGNVSATVAAAASSAVSRPAAPRGLDPAVLAAIPTLMYADVKRLKAGDGALECAVCLCEFDDKEFLRMLPRCCHVFHLDCIDTWLESHVTCPVCRSDIALAAAAADDDDKNPEHVSVDVAAAEEAAELARMASRKRAGRLARSHTTGRAVWVRPGDGGLDRCTLRLPENVRRELVEGKGIQRAASCAGSGRLFSREESSRSGYRVGSMRVMRTSSAPRFLRTSSAREISGGTGGGLLDWLVGSGRASATVNVVDDDKSTVETSRV